MKTDTLSPTNADDVRRYAAIVLTAILYITMYAIALLVK